LHTQQPSPLPVMLSRLSSFTFTSLSFSLYGSAPPLDLHSFPTRRSSDLGPGPPEPARGRARRGAGERSTGRRVREPREHSARSPDRKSTRLNSSHRTISYAVFCLKKKKIKTKQTNNTN